MKFTGINPVCALVLIETYWNVKSIKSFDLAKQISINRNILECKGGCKIEHDAAVACINRNILECKEKRRGVCVTHTGGINRNILECKVRLREIVSTRRSGINRNILECKGLSPPAVRHTAVRY